MIVDAQIHLWDKGTPPAHHQQQPFSMDQALAGMAAAGVDRAVIHPTRTRSPSRRRARIPTASRFWAGSRSIARRAVP
jgi:hypothetical protein